MRIVGPAQLWKAGLRYCGGVVIAFVDQARRNGNMVMASRWKIRPGCGAHGDRFLVIAPMRPALDSAARREAR